MSGTESAVLALPDGDKPDRASGALTAALRRRLGVLDDAETAAVLGGFQTSTLTRWRTNGEGPPYVKIGNRVLYRETDLIAWLALRVETTAEMKYQFENNE